MSRTPLVIANWKMNKTLSEATFFIESIKKEFSNVSKRVWIAPPFISIAACVQAAEGTSLRIGAQNMHTQEEGAFTGEVSARMLKGIGAHFVIIGHSERRAFFGESEKEINEKIKRALSHHLTPVLCVGESLEQRERGEEKIVLRDQLEGGLEGLSSNEIAQMVISYEPVWAIGTGKVATPAMAQNSAFFIREFLAENWGKECAQKISLLYGGSVKADSVPLFIAEPDVDGVLVGGASLDLRAFMSMIQG